MKRKTKKERRFFIKENLYLLPVLGMILGLFVLPFLNKGSLIAYIVSVYAAVSAIYTYFNELIDCYKETQKYKDLPDEIKQNIQFRRCLAPFVLLSFIFSPIILFSSFSYWTNYSLHWGVLGLTILASAIFSYFDDIKEENEEVCDGYNFCGDYL